MAWSRFGPGPTAVALADGISSEWKCDERDEPDHTHVIGCLWVWHDCAKILGPESVAPANGSGGGQLESALTRS